MNDFDEYTTEQLEKISTYNQLIFTQNCQEAEIIHRAAIRDLELEQEKHRAKMYAVQEEGLKESMRPHKMYGTTVYFSQMENIYYCKMLKMFDDEDDETGDIFAVGDTPAQACDNFDYLWVHGNQTR